MNPHDQMMEALGILQEECAEIITVISKIRRFGLNTQYYNTDSTKKDALNEEIGDLLTMIGVLIKQGVLDQQVLHQAALAKIKKLKKHSTLQNLDNIII